MQRRSLLGLALASPLGFLVPRSAKASLLPGSQYAHFGELFDEIADFASESPNPEVLSADEPARLLLGYMASYTEGNLEHTKIWNIHVTELPRLLDAMPDPTKRQLVERDIQTQAGRVALAQSIHSESQRLRNLLPIARALSRPAAKKRLAAECKTWER